MGLGANKLIYKQEIKVGGSGKTEQPHSVI